MKGILYYLAHSFLWLITLLPLRILYFISDLLYVFIYTIGRYRKKTIFTNLRRSFPDRSPAEISRIAKDFYHQLCDYFIEWMYGIHMGDKELARRMHYRNPEIFNQYRDQGKNVMLLFSHHGNWEWTSRISLASGYTTLAVYKELHNRYFDRLFLKLRGKFGVTGVPMKNILRSIIEYQRKEIPVIVFSLADQRPQWRNIHLWTNFLNQDTPVITGPEKIARKFDMPVVYFAIDKIKRGYYEAEFQVICEHPREVPEFEITRTYLGTLEEAIKKKPELWLWTHRRWKHNRNSGPEIPAR